MCHCQLSWFFTKTGGGLDLATGHSLAFYSMKLRDSIASLALLHQRETDRSELMDEGLT